MRAIISILLVCTIASFIVKEGSCFCSCANYLCPPGMTTIGPECGCGQYYCTAGDTPEKNGLPPAPFGPFPFGTQTAAPKYVPKGNEASPDGGNCYYSFHSEALTWSAAKAQCEGRNRILATFDDDTRRVWINQFIKNKGAANNFTWLGGRACGPIWEWIENRGEIPAVKGQGFWAGPEPSGDQFGFCINMYFADGKLNDGACSYATQYVCMDKNC